jgi:YegS/Rv2252/BmrU family lipid kinase
MPKAMLVYNPYAGRYPSWLLSERAAKLLSQNGWEIEMKQSQQAMNIVQLAQQAADRLFDAFFIVGGDGSINLAARGLAGSQTALGVLPGGTSNVFAQELGLPGLSWTRIMALEESARLLSNAESRWIDMGWCGATPFLLWAGAGLDGFVVHHIEPRGRWEKHFAGMSYAASAVWHAAFWRGVNMVFIVDGQQIKGHYLMGLASNVHLYAGGILQLSAQARLDDGMLDLWLFEGDTIGDTVQCAWDLFAGRLTDTGRVRRIPFEYLSIQTDVPLYLQVDGEPLDFNGHNIELRVQRQALRVLVPSNTPWQLFSERNSL